MGGDSLDACKVASVVYILLCFCKTHLTCPCVCMCVHVCTYDLRTHVCVCVWRSKVNVEFFPQWLPTLFFETGALIEPEVYHLATLVGQYLPMIQLSPLLGYICMATSIFYMSSGDWSSCLHACVTDTLVSHLLSPFFNFSALHMTFEEWFVTLCWNICRIFNFILRKEARKVVWASCLGAGISALFLGCCPVWANGEWSGAGLHLEAEQQVW